MKNSIFQTENFRQISDEEAFSCAGGGFAYDAGRFLRFGGLCFTPGGGFLAALDAYTNSVINKC